MKLTVEEYREIAQKKCRNTQDEAHFRRHLDALIKQDQSPPDGTGIPEKWRAIEVTAYTDGKEVVIIGEPEEEDPAPGEDYKHNCDHMGCGMAHILYRAPLSCF